MGHIPSKQFETEPFFFDIESKSQGVLHHALLAATSTNFPHGPDFAADANSFAGQLLGLRSSPAVRGWYKRESLPPRHEPLPRAPTPEEFFKSVFARADLIYAKNLPLKEFVPMPVVVLRMRPDFIPKESSKWNEGSKWARWKPTPENSTVLGYFGLRHFNDQGQCFGMGRAVIWLDKALGNDAKSTAVLKAAAKCFQVFSERFARIGSPAAAGVQDTASTTMFAVPWPKAASFNTLITNYPYLTLVQKVWDIVVVDREKRCAQSSQSEVFKSNDLHGGTEHDMLIMYVENGRVFFLIKQALPQMCEALANEVTLKDSFYPDRPCYTMSMNRIDSSKKEKKVDEALAEKNIDFARELEAVEHETSNHVAMGKLDQAIQVLCDFARSKWNENDNPIKALVDECKQQELFSTQFQSWKQNPLTIKLPKLSGESTTNSTGPSFDENAAAAKDMNPKNVFAPPSLPPRQSRAKKKSDSNAFYQFQPHHGVLPSPQFSPSFNGASYVSPSGSYRHDSSSSVQFGGHPDIHFIPVPTPLHQPHPMMISHPTTCSIPPYSPVMFPQHHAGAIPLQGAGGNAINPVILSSTALPADPPPYE